MMNHIHFKLWASALSHSRALCSKKVFVQFSDVKFLRTTSRQAYMPASTRTSLPKSFFSPQGVQPSLAWARWYRARSNAKVKYTDFLESPLRRRFNRLPASYILYGIMGINGFVFLCWQSARNQAAMGDITLYKSMWDNFLLSWRNVREGRIWTILTASFSHEDLPHILFNGLAFYFMAPEVIRLLGNASFVGLYFLGGIGSSIISLLFNRTVAQREGASRGASGAVYAVLSFFTCIRPNATFLLYFVIPMPAWILVSGIFIWDGWSTITDRKTQTDGAGHIGGILTGLAYFLYRRSIRV